MTMLTGTISLSNGPNENARVVALDANGALLAETLADTHGHWQLSSVTPISRVLAYVTNAGITASIVPSDQATTLVLPMRHPCRFQFSGNESNTGFWLNPIELIGFPGDMIEALHWHIDGSFALHVCSWPCEGDEVVVWLQEGDYRLGGGRIAFHPGGAAALELNAVTANPGKAVAMLEGDFVLRIRGPLCIRLHFCRSDSTIPEKRIL